MRFITAVVIFVNFWLIALGAFGTATAAIFLCILNGVRDAIAASTAASLVCSMFTVVYLVLQSINVAHIKRSRWHARWLSPTCVQLPRVLIAFWVPTAAIGLWSTLKQPTCESGSVVANANAWQNGLGCWVFRVMVSLTVVMMVLALSNLIMLEINGRRVPIGLFHFEYTVPERGFEHSRRYRRSNLGRSPFGTSVESLASPRTITSEEELQLTSSAEKLQPRSPYDISPSPTYRTLDFPVARCRTLSHSNMLASGQREASVDLPASRNSTCTTLTLSSFPATPTSAAHHASIFASSQLASRRLSVSDLPALPTSFQRQVQELEIIKHRSMIDASRPIRPALSNVTNASGKFRSSSAVPLAIFAEDDTDISVEKTRSLSLTEVVEKPPPAWCSGTKFKSMPLSADPAIKRLTELRRNSKLGVGFDQMSRRISLSGFEFGFGGSPRKPRATVVDEEMGKQALVSSNAEDLSNKAKGKATAGGAAPLRRSVHVVKKQSDPDKDETATSKRTIERKHPIRSPTPGHPKRPSQNFSVMPPSVPARAAGHVRSQSNADRKHGKSVVERGRYETLSR